MNPKRKQERERGHLLALFLPEQGPAKHNMENKS